MKKSMQDNNSQIKLQKLQNQLENIENESHSLIEFLLNDIIYKESYQKQKEQYDIKIENIQKEIESLNLVIECKENIETGISKFKELLDTNIKLEEFDKDIFNA